jgi:DNA-binding MarR family transcriptional regulator
MATKDGNGSADEISVSNHVASMLAPMLNQYKRNIDLMVQPLGISAGQFPVISLLCERDGQNQKDLALQLSVMPSSLTSMLNRMETGGFICRRRDTRDHRVYQIFLTPKGRQVGKKLGAVIRFMDERNLAGFMNEEKLLFLRFMRHMAANLEKQNNELLLLKENNGGK